MVSKPTLRSYPALTSLKPPELLVRLLLIDGPPRRPPYVPSPTMAEREGEVDAFVAADASEEWLVAVRVRSGSSIVML